MPDDNSEDEIFAHNKKRAERAVKEVVILFAIIMIITFYVMVTDH